MAQELGKNFEMAGQEHQHLATVMRMQVGEKIIVYNGDDFCYLYEISKISKTSTSLIFIKKEENPRNPKAKLTVFMALIKQDMGQVVQKLNELGVSDLVLWNADRSNVALKSVNIEKLQTIANQSCKQCGRSRPLKVSFGKLEDLKSFDQVLFADEKYYGMARLNDVPLNPESKIVILIGPEGGFADKEREWLNWLENMKQISLGYRVLRTETAVVAMSAIVMSKLEEM